MYTPDKAETAYRNGYEAGRARAMREAKLETILKMRETFELHFGTYTDKTKVSVSEVFCLLNNIAERIMEV